MKVVLPEVFKNLSKDQYQRIRSLGDVTVYDQDAGNETEMLDRVKDAEIVALSWLDLTEDIIRKSPKLKYLITLSSGYSQLPMQALNAAGVKVINCPHHNSEAVAEHTIALMFAVTRKIVESHLAMQKGAFKNSAYDYAGEELAGKNLLIIGYGNIGKIVAARAYALDMTVAYANSKTTPAQLDAMLQLADFVSLNLPANKTTFHMMDERRLLLMKRSAYLINTARGELIDEQALAKMLTSGNLAGAALDVFEHEPPTAAGTASASITALAKLPNVITTPHIAFNTREAGIRLGEEFIKNLKACLKNRPVNIVN